MTTLLFRLADRLDGTAQNAVLSSVRGVPGVLSADRVDPSSEHPLVTRMCFAEVNGGIRLEQVESRLEEIEGVESIEVPPRRELI